jgi:hypothetical protein
LPGFRYRAASLLFFLWEIDNKAERLPYDSPGAERLPYDSPGGIFHKQGCIDVVSHLLAGFEQLLLAGGLCFTGISIYGFFLNLLYSMLDK